MENVQFSSTSVDTSLPTLWEILLDNIVHPERYLSEITNCEIIKKSGSEIIRKIKSKFGEFVERITIDFKNLEISFRLLNHPDFTGTLVSKIIPPLKKGGLVMLTFVRNWKPRHPKTGHSVRLPSLKEALMNTKIKAEKK